MSAPRVEVWDPSAEGPELVEALQEEGFEVHSVALGAVVLTAADVVILAGDGEGALGALKLLRDEGARGDVPVVLLGVPEGTEPRGDGPAFGADAVFARPVAFDALVARIWELVGEADGTPEHSHVGATPERTMRLAGEADPQSSQVFVLGGHVAPPGSRDAWRPPEPTHALAPDVSSVLSRGATPPPGTGSGSRPGTGPLAADVPEPVIPAGARAQLSPWLDELLRSADRRVFPDRPSLALHFPAANERPHELVPPELLEAAAFRIDEPVVEDPIDAFTYVGGPAVPPPIQSAATPAHDARREHETSPETPQRLSRPPGARRASAPPSDHEPTVDWPADDTSLGRPDPDGTRRGTLGRGGALRLLWRVAALGLDGLLELTCEDGPSARMTFLAGELRAFDGEVATSALATLRRRGRASEAPADEAGAEAVLQRLVEEGRLGRFERDRLMREAREAILHDIVQRERARFTLRRRGDTEPGRPLARARVLGRPLRAALVELARTALGVDEVRALFGGPVGLALGPAREAGFGPAELPSELAELLVRMEGRSFAEILAAAPTERGLAGVLYALVAADVLVLTEAPAEAAPSPEARAAIRALVESAAALGEDGDYFAILGVAPDAADADVERAHAARSAELAAIPLSAVGLDPLAPRRDDALRAIDEAYRALGDPRRRRAYAAALRA